MTRILVVDDEAGVRTLLTRALGLHHYAVDAVNDGAEAVDQLQKKHYDLMIIDRYMPVMTGPEAVDVIRSSDRFQTLKILMLTGESVMKEIEAAFDSGVDGYLLKPFRVENLLAKVERSLCTVGS